MFGTNMGTYTENPCGVCATVLLSGDHFSGSPYRCYFLGFVGASMLDNFNVTTTPQRVCLFCGYPCFGDLKVKLEGKQQHIVIFIYIYMWFRDKRIGCLKLSGCSLWGKRRSLALGLFRIVRRLAAVWRGVRSFLVKTGCGKSQSNMHF